MYLILVILISGGALFYASYSIRLGVYIKSLCRNKKAGRVVAVTFDDGPHPVMTPRILEVLKKHGATAAFFLTGTNAVKYPGIVKLIAEQGHEIGNHSYRHSWSFPLIKQKAMIEELDKTDTVIKEITGKKPEYFRPPFGVTNPVLAKALRRTGHIPVGWSIRSLDTLGKSRCSVLRRITGKLHEGAVILMHDTMPGADELTDMVLEDIKKRNYKTVSIRNLFN